MSSTKKEKTLRELLSEYGYEETYDNELPHYVHYNISQENALKAFLIWLEQKRKDFLVESVFGMGEETEKGLEIFDKLIKELE